MEAMQAYKAHVHNGRLLLDEPTDLPEGEVVYLQVASGVVPDETDDLDPEKRAALNRELDASISEADAGQTEDFGAFLARRFEVTPHRAKLLPSTDPGEFNRLSDALSDDDIMRKVKPGS
jgi:hypothetical protein